MGTIIASAFVIKAVINFGKASVEAANAQIEAETKLAEVLKTRTNATDEQIQSIKDLATAQQSLGVIGDDVQLAGAQQLATFVKNTEAVENLLPAMNNLAAQQKGVGATSGDLTNIANLMGKALDGQVGALSRVGISFSDAQAEILKTGTEMERSAVLAEVITGNVGEMNLALAQTDAGKMQQASNIFGDMQEQVGMFLLPKLAELVVWIQENVFPVLQQIGETFGKIWTDAQPLIAEFMEEYAPLFTKFLEDAKKLITVLFTAFKWGFDFISPIIAEWIEEFAPMFAEFFTAIVELVEVFFEVFKTVMTALEPFIKPILDGLKFAFKLIFDNITQAIKLVTAIFKGDWQGAFDALKEIGNNFLTFWGTLFGKIGDVMKSVIRVSLNSTIAAVEAGINFLLEGIRKVIRAYNSIPGAPNIEVPGQVNLGRVPEFAVGSNYIPYDMMAMVHEGEQIVPKSANPHANPFTSNGGMTININNPNIYDERGIDMMMERVVTTLKNRGVVPA